MLSGVYLSRRSSKQSKDKTKENVQILFCLVTILRSLRADAYSLSLETEKSVAKQHKYVCVHFDQKG